MFDDIVNKCAFCTFQGSIDKAQILFDPSYTKQGDPYDPSCSNGKIHIYSLQCVSKLGDFGCEEVPAYIYKLITGRSVQ